MVIKMANLDKTYSLAESYYIYYYYLVTRSLYE